jgi:hypothetical protein
MDGIIKASSEQAFTGKLVHLAIPLRWSLVAHEGRGPVEMGCTYDIHPRGARLSGSGAVNVGDLVLIERGRNKAVCQVVWTADRNSLLRGQFTVQCVEPGRTPWEEELRQMAEQYQPIILDAMQRRFPAKGKDGDGNRRRRPRFYVEGKADLIDGMQRVQGDVQQLSEFGARIAAKDLPRPGTDFRLVLNIFDVSLALKAKVKYLVDDSGGGVEFQQIRRGDRPLLSYVLSQLRNRRVEEYARIEVAEPPLVGSAE